MDVINFDAIIDVTYSRLAKIDNQGGPVALTIVATGITPMQPYERNGRLISVRGVFQKF